MELWLILLCLSSILFAIAGLLHMQHRMRSKETFVALEAQALNDISQPPLMGQAAMGQTSEVVTPPLRFRYVINGSERLGHRVNPWDLPAVPRIIQGNTIAAFYSSARDEAYLDCRTTLIRSRIPFLGGLAMLGLGLLLLWLQ